MFPAFKKISIGVLICAVFLVTGKFCVAAVFESDSHNGHEVHFVEKIVGHNECAGEEYFFAASAIHEKVKVMGESHSNIPLFVSCSYEKAFIFKHPLNYVDPLLPPPEKDLLASIFKKE